MSAEVIPLNKIRTGLNAADWKDAIRLAGEILLNAGSITDKYIESMINAVIDLGPYMVIMPGFALAHAAPGEANGNIKNDFSLINLVQPVNFINDQNPVSVVLCMSNVDHDSHLQNMRRVAMVISEDGVVDKLAMAKTDQEVYEIMNADM
ncbi:MAG: PTS sugar transporter subunit IIA [Oscillospiraceae bacterium]